MSTFLSTLTRFRRRSDERRNLVRGNVESLDPMRLRGWAFGIDGEHLGLSVVMEGREWPLPAEWHSRQDVGDVYGEEALESGFVGHPGEELALALRRAQLDGRRPDVLANGSPLGWPALTKGASVWQSEGPFVPSIRERMARLELTNRDDSLFGLAAEVRAAQGPKGDPEVLPALISALQKRFDAGSEELVAEVIDKLARAGAFHVLPMELALIRSCAPIALSQGAGVDGSVLQAAFLNWHHEAGEGRRLHMLREALAGVLAHLALWRAFAQPGPGDAEGLRALRVPLARWVDRITRNERMALDIIDLLDVTPASGREAELLLQARLDSFAGRYARALGTFADLLSAGSQDWYVYHQSVVLAKTFLVGRLGLARRYLPALIHRLADASTRNGEQCLSRREAWAAVADFARAAINDSSERARSGDVELAVLARSADLRLACAQALRAVGVGDSTLRQGAWRSRSRRRVLFWGSKGLFQCYQYRVCQKFAQAGALGIEVDYLDLTELVPLDWRRRLMGAAVLYACRVPATPEYMPVFAYARALGIPVIYDIDDLIFDPEVFPPPLHTYAGTIDEETHRRLALDNPFFLEGLRFADQITVSTPALAREVKRHLDASVPVTVLPNLLDEALAAEARSGEHERRRNDEDVVIFYGSATKAHKEDFYRIFLPAALEVLDCHPTARLELVGFFEDLPNELLLSGRIRVEPPTPDFAAYLARLQEADISIAVLEESRSTDVKSEIKWLEASVYGIPSVVSPTATYREALNDGVDVLFARDVTEWTKQLGLLVEDASLRARIGEAARARALERFGPEQGTRILGGILKPLLPASRAQRRKRVMLANVYYHPQSIGGATRVVEAQVRGLREQMAEEFEVFVLTTNNDPDPQRPHGVTQYWHEDVLVTALEIPRREWAQAEDQEVELFTKEFLETYEIDLVHAHCIQVLTCSVLVAARALGIPYIITLHDGWWLSRYIFLVDENGELVDHRDPLSGGTLSVGERPNLMARAQRLRSVLRGAERLLAVSPKFAEVYREAGFTQVEVHENFSVLRELRPRSRRVLKPDSHIVVGFIGGLSRHKGYHLVRRAIEEGGFRNIQMVVVDHGLEHGERYHMEWGDTPVEFIGRHHQSEVAELYARLDVLLAPSIWPESFGLVTREAIHAGVWVIASDRGAIGDCVEEGVSGNVVTVEDHRPLMEAMRRVPDALAGRAINALDGSRIGRSTAEHLEALKGIYLEALCG